MARENLPEKPKNLATRARPVCGFGFVPEQIFVLPLWVIA
jgi:hypothetical protein